MHLGVILGLFIPLVIGTTYATTNKTEPLPPTALVKKCLKNSIEQTNPEEPPPEPILTAEEIEAQCNRTTEYKTYIDCLTHYSNLNKSRQKRNTIIDCDDDEDDECDNGDCNSCQNSCQSCGYNCNGCSSCSTCQTRPCCQKQCHRKCRTASCRRNCKSDCYGIVERGGSSSNSTNQLSATANATNIIDEAINITTIIKFNNLINTSNIVDIPIVVNNTNVNNITISQLEQAAPPSPIYPPQQNETAEQCCHVIYPRTCVAIPEAPYKRCFHRRRRFCGDACINIPDLNITSQVEQIPQQPQTVPQPESQSQVIIQPQPQPQLPIYYPQPPPLTPCQRNQMMMYPPQYIPQYVPQYVPQYIPQYIPQYVPQYTPQYAPPQVIQQTHQPQIVQQQPQVIQQQLPQVIQQQPQVIQQQPQVIHIQPQIPPQIHQTITPCTKPGCGAQIQVQPQIPVAPTCPQGCSSNFGYYGYQSPQNFYNYPSFDTYLTQAQSQARVGQQVQPQQLVQQLQQQQVQQQQLVQQDQPQQDQPEQQGE